MKKIIICLILFASLESCTTIKKAMYIHKSKISVKEVIDRKELLDKSDNPAERYLIIRNLSDKRVVIKNVLVSDIINSTNIDYKFCVVVKVPYSKGEVECFIYAKRYELSDFITGDEDLQTVARLKKGKSTIDVEGDFARFFLLLDENYAKIEIVNAIIIPKEEKK